MPSSPTVSRMSQRVPLTVLMVVLLARCGSSSCGCLVPLEEPFPAERRLNNAVQARITPEGFSFMNQKLPSIIGAFYNTDCDGVDGVICPSGYTCGCPAGVTCDSCPANNRLCTLTNPRTCQANPAPAQPTIGFRVPSTEENFTGSDSDVPKTRVCHPDVAVSWDNCRVYAQMKSTTLAPSGGTDLDLSVSMGITTPARPNGIKLYYNTGASFFAPDARCTVYIQNADNLSASGKLRVGRDPRTDRATFELLNLDVPLNGDNLDIRAESGDDTITCFTLNIGFVKDLIIGQVKDTLVETLTETIQGALAPIRTQPCDPAVQGYQCPRLADGTMSVCSAQDSLCHFPGAGGAPVPGLLGLEGQLALGDSLPDFLRVDNNVAFTAYAGGTRTGGSNAVYFANGGMNLGLVGGAFTPPSGCVPPRQSAGNNVPSYDFPATIQPAAGGAAAPYMAGIAVSDLLLGEVLGEAYSGGLLCQQLSTSQVGLINSGIIGLLLGESSTLAEINFGGAPARPVVIDLKPRNPLLAQIGLGTQHQEGMRTVLDDPLLTLFVDDLDLDIYTLVDDRWMRLATLGVDLHVGLALELNAQNQLHLVGNSVEDWIGDITVRNADVLNQSAADIEAAVPELLASLLPQFAPTLDQVFDLPSLQGFELRNVRVRGTGTQIGMTAFNKPRFQFLGLFADLGFNAANVAPFSVRARTEATVRKVHLPRPEDMAASRGRERDRVTVTLDMKSTFVTRPDAVLEHSYRVDAGLWHPYHVGNTLFLTDATLNLQGWHTVDVRSRVVGAPDTLDEEGVTLRVLSDVEAPTVSAARSGDALELDVMDRVAAAEALVVEVRVKGQDWVRVDGGAHRSVLLGAAVPAQAYVEVRATDEAGHVGTTSVGDPAWEPASAATGRLAGAAPTDTPAAQGCGGCEGSGADGGLAGLALAALALFRRRRA